MWGLHSWFANMHEEGGEGWKRWCLQTETATTMGAGGKTLGKRWDDAGILYGWAEGYM